VGVQEVRWDKGGTLREVDYTYFFGKGKEIHKFWRGYFCTLQNNIRVEFISDWMSSAVVAAAILLFWMSIHQLRRKMIRQRTVFMRNYSWFSIIFLITIWKFCQKKHCLGLIKAVVILNCGFPLPRMSDQSVVCHVFAVFWRDMATVAFFRPENGDSTFFQSVVPVSEGAWCLCSVIHSMSSAW